MERSRLLISLLILFFIDQPVLAAGEKYGAYGLYPQGSHRVTAMGGAYTALSDDATGVTYNPAGLAFQTFWGDLGGNYNSVWNREVDLNGDGTKDGIPYGYFYYAATFRSGRFGFGIGVNSPYAIDLPLENMNGSFTEKRTLKLSIETFNIPIAYRLNDQWSVGFNLQGSTLKERYQFTTTNPGTPAIDVSTQKEASGITSGISYRPNENWGFGAYYQPRTEFLVDPALNNQTGGVNWFKSVVVPAKTSLGSFYRKGRFLYSLDADYVEGITNTVFVGSELIPQFRKAEIDDSPKLILHGGAEWHAIDTKMWDLFGRMGTYNEPPRLKGAVSRQHLSAGIEVRYWLLSLSVAADMADDFINAAAGFGISLKSYL